MTIGLRSPVAVHATPQQDRAAFATNAAIIAAWAQRFGRRGSLIVVDPAITRADAEDYGRDLVILPEVPSDEAGLDGVLREACRVLSPGGRVIVRVDGGVSDRVTGAVDRWFARVERFSLSAGASEAVPVGDQAVAADGVGLVLSAVRPRFYVRSTPDGVETEPVGAANAEWSDVHQGVELAFHKRDGQWRWTPLWDEHQKAMFEGRWGFAPGSYAGQWVLDIGAGPRLRTEWFVGATLVGVEPLADRFPELNHGAYEHPGVREIHASPAERAIPSLAGRFDLAVCHNVLDHCYDWKAVVRAAAAALKPGGLFVLSTDVGKPDAPGHPGIESKGALLAECRRSGFVVERVIDRSEQSPIWERTVAMFLRKPASG